MLNPKPFLDSPEFQFIAFHWFLGSANCEGDPMLPHVSIKEVALEDRQG